MQSIRNEKLKVLQALRPISGDDVLKQCIRAQYTAAGETGASMVGYHQEANIHASSTTETYCALRVFIDSWRWAGVPFYLRAGKRLSTNLTEIAIQFKPVPHRIFPASSGPIQPNVLVIRVQPDEGIHLSVQSKVPGMTLKLSTVQMNFSYQESFGAFRPDAYERLLIDALHGEQSLFIGNEEIETAWRFIDPILSRWQSAPTAPLESYAAGSAGPAGAQTLLEEDGRAWRALGKTAAS
jgi:glucose-6-phosphate 1-dehydrogenase